MLKSSHYTWVAKNILTVNYLDVISGDGFPPKWIANHSFTPNTLCNFGVRINSCKSFSRQVIHFRHWNVFSPSHLQRGPLLRRQLPRLMTTRALFFCQQISLLYCQWPVVHNNSILSQELIWILSSTGNPVKCINRRIESRDLANWTWHHSGIKLIKPLSILKYPPRCYDPRSFPFSIYQYFQYFVFPDVMNFDFNGIFILICFVSNNPIKEHEN